MSDLPGIVLCNLAAGQLKQRVLRFYSNKLHNYFSAVFAIG